MVAQGKRRSRKRHSLNVWMNGQLVGTWTVAENRPQRFQYVEAWVKSQAARILSLSLPFQPGNQAHGGKAVENFVILPVLAVVLIALCTLYYPDLVDLLHRRVVS